MSRWFRFYDEAINDPKVLKLSDSLYRFWVGVLCVASKSEGKLPPVCDLALMLRMKPDRIRKNIEHLVNSGLLDEFETTHMPHNWSGRQYKSDVSTERVKRFRNVSLAVSQTPPETETETDSEKKEDAPNGATPTKFFFESGVIRLTKKNFDDWVVAFPNLSLRAELLSLTPWAEAQPKWFHPVSAALAKRNREIEIKLKTPPQARQLTRDGQPWPEGIV